MSIYICPASMPCCFHCPQSKQGLDHSLCDYLSALLALSFLWVGSLVGAHSHTVLFSAPSRSSAAPLVLSHTPLTPTHAVPAWPVALILSGQSRVCIGPLCAPASQNPNSSAFSLHGAALCVLHKILQIPQFIWAGQLQVCMQQCPISPHFLWIGQSCVRIPQCFPSSALSPGGGGSHMSPQPAVGVQSSTL